MEKGEEDNSGRGDKHSRVPVCSRNCPGEACTQFTLNTFLNDRLGGEQSLLLLSP